LTDKKSIFQGALKDAKKLVKTKKQYPDASIYISTVIYGVNTSTRSPFNRFNITYGDHGMNVEADFFLTRIERDSAKEVERDIRSAIFE